MHKLKIALLVCLAASVICPGVSAFSNVDAVNYVVSSNYFLYDGETYSAPNVPVSYGDKGYWLVPLTAGNDVVTYFPVDSETGKLSSSDSANRELFSIADNLRELQGLKASLSQGSGVEWLFTQKYQTIFNETSLSLNDEGYRLSTVDVALAQAGMQASTSGLKASLVSMASLSSQLSKSVADSAKAENDFFTSPSSDGFSKMNDSFAASFGLIASLNTMGLSYQSSLSKLKNEISVSGIDTQTKAQLEPLLRVPESLTSLRNYNLNAAQLSQAIASRQSASSMHLDSMLEQLNERVAKDRVYKLIYSDSDKLRKEGFSSLSKAQASILSTGSISLWQNQAKVVALRDDYAKATDYYSKRQFSLAEKSALLAVDDAVAVIKGGRKQVAGAAPDISQDLLFKVAGALILLLALLYAFNNRSKIKGFASKAPDEIDVYGGR
ncbi:Uncharacterised protein [uncultured archaeon]|nr:Uncharacterised protein [uncultured archaeon]